MTNFYHKHEFLTAPSWIFAPWELVDFWSHGWFPPHMQRSAEAYFCYAKMLWWWRDISHHNQQDKSSYALQGANISIHIPPGEKEHHLQKCLGRGYVSSYEGNKGIPPLQPLNCWTLWRKLPTLLIWKIGFLEMTNDMATNILKCQESCLDKAYQNVSSGTTKPSDGPKHYNPSNMLVRTILWKL